MTKVSELVSANIASAIENYNTWGGIIANVKTYGAKGNGTNDDTTAIQTAINSLAGLGGTVFLPPGTYITTSTLLITQSNVWIIGSGSNYNHDLGESGGGGTTIQWNGAAGGTVFKFTSVLGSTHAATTNLSLQNLAINCNTTAAYGVEMYSLKKSIFQDLLIFNPRIAAIKMGVLSVLGEARDFQFCKFNRINMRLLEYPNAIGIKITGEELANTSFNSFEQIDVVYAGNSAIGIEMGGSDNNLFTQIRTIRASGTGIGIKLLSGVTNGEAATAIEMLHIDAGQGGLVLQATAGQFPSGANLQWYEQGNGAPNPVVEAGATLNWYDHLSGTWTPVINTTGTLGTNTYSVRKGIYYKIDKQITLVCRIVFLSKDAAMSGQVYLTGLPFPFSSKADIVFSAAMHTVGVDYNQNSSSLTGVTGLMAVSNYDPSLSYIAFQTEKAAATASARILAGSLTSSSEITFTLTYLTD